MNQRRLYVNVGVMGNVLFKMLYKCTLCYKAGDKTDTETPVDKYL